MTLNLNWKILSQEFDADYKISSLSVVINMYVFTYIGESFDGDDV